MKKIQSHSEKYSKMAQLIKFPMLLSYINGSNNLLLTLSNTLSKVSFKSAWGYQH